MSRTESTEPRAVRTLTSATPGNGLTSCTQLAAKARLSVSAITNAVRGKTTPAPETVIALVGALRVEPETVSGRLDRTVVRGPHTPPAEAAPLSKDERDVIDTLIRALALGREERGHGNAAATITAGGTPAVMTCTARRSAPGRGAAMLRHDVPADALGLAARRDKSRARVLARHSARAHGSRH